MSNLSNEYNTDFIKQLLDKIDSLTSVVLQQTATINKLTETISKQQEEITSLREQLNKNSKNSSKPPSSDGFNKPKPKSLRKPSGKNQGTQKGHKGSGFSITQVPDETIDYIPSRCNGSSLFGICTSCGMDRL